MSLSLKDSLYFDKIENLLNVTFIRQRLRQEEKVSDIYQELRFMIPYNDTEGRRRVN